MQAQACTGGAMKGRPWTPEEDAHLCAHFPNSVAAEIAQHLGRSVPSVYGRAHGLGLQKSPDFFASNKFDRQNLGAGAKFRFQKGQHAWNAGISYQPGGRSVLSRFAAGNLPHNHKPIGTERTIYGFLERKVADTKNRNIDWVGVHVLLWREAGREIPPGMFLVFKDRNPKNITIENLELVDRAENMRRNSIQRYTPELKSAIRAVGKLKRKIAEREKQNH